MTIELRHLASGRNIPNKDLTLLGCDCKAAAVRTESSESNPSTWCRKRRNFTSARYIENMRHIIPPSGRKEPAVRTEHGKGWGILAKKLCCQHSIDIPKPRYALVRCREKKTIVGRAELHVLDQATMAHDGRKQRAAFDVPNADRPIEGCGGQEPIVRTEGAIH